jgi:heterodisulfide reductase subunit B
MNCDRVIKVHVECDVCGQDFEEYEYINYDKKEEIDRAVNLALETSIRYYQFQQRHAHRPEVEYYE